MNIPNLFQLSSNDTLFVLAASSYLVVALVSFFLGYIPMKRRENKLKKKARAIAEEKDALKKFFDALSEENLAIISALETKSSDCELLNKELGMVKSTLDIAEKVSSSHLDSSIKKDTLLSEMGDRIISDGLKITELNKKLAKYVKRGTSKKPRKASGKKSGRKGNS